MLKRKILILICSFLFYNEVCAQAYLGVRFEYIRYQTESKSRILGAPSNVFEYDKPYKSDVGLIIPFTFSLEEDFSLSMRLGFVFGDLYAGPEYTVLAKYDLLNEIYLISGLNIHNNMEVGGHSKTGYSKTIPFLVIGVGHQLKSIGPIEFQFTHRLNDVQYGRERGYAPMSNFKDIYYKAIWMIKLNLGLEWEL